MFISSNVHRNDAMSVVGVYSDEDDMKRFLCYTYTNKCCILL
jgi:hypothetical protein